MMLKLCKICQIEKPLDAFHKNQKNKDGFETRCKICRKQLRRLEYEKRKKTPIDNSRVETKKCTKCVETKKLEYFYRNNTGVFGRSSWCKRCCKQHDAIRQNTEKHRAKNRAYYYLNKDAFAKYQQEYLTRPEIREQRRKYEREYSKTPIGKEISRRKNDKRRAIEKKAYLEDIPQSFINLLLQKQDGCCAYCSISFDESPFSYEVEHLIPYERGGFNLRGNVHLACKSCNSSKCAKTHDEYLVYRESSN